MQPAPTVRPPLDAPPTSAWQRWLHHPESLWFRKCFFHFHVWVGAASGFYVLIMSLSGSVLVYRDNLSNAFSRQPPAVNVSGPRLTPEQMKAAAGRIYPRYRVTEIAESDRMDQPDTVVLEDGKKTIARLFNPYDGADLGSPDSDASLAINWLADLHENLLAGSAGRVANGFGAISLAILCVTGAVIWWPGVKHWRRSMSVDWKMPFPRLDWDLHSALGFWCFAFLLLWGISGMYFCFPNAFNAIFELLNVSAQPDKLGLGDILLAWLSRLHFGRLNPVTKAVWALAGLVPAILSLTGIFLCCHRLLDKSASPAHPHNQPPPSSTAEHSGP